MALIDLTGRNFDGRKPVSGAGGQQTITPAASTSLTVPAGARFATVCPVTQAIRITLGGVTPTATVGIHVNTGDTVLLGPGQLAAAKMIQEAASASVDVEYFS